MAQAVAEMAGVSSLIMSSTDKTNCKVTLRSEAVFPTMKDWTQHWGLSVALDGIAAYQNWISGSLLPIAFLWIYEHLDEIKEYRTLDNPDDIDELVKAAFEFARDKHYFKAREFNFHPDYSALKPGDINPTWARISKELRGKIRENCKYPDLKGKLSPH